MKKHAFFLVSVLLATIALIFHITGYNQNAKGAEHKAHSIAAAIEQNVKIASDQIAKNYFNEGHTFNSVGIVFTLSSVACLLLAFYRRESGWYSIPILLLFFDLMTQMLL